MRKYALRNKSAFFFFITKRIHNTYVGEIRPKFEMPLMFPPGGQIVTGNKLAKLGIDASQLKAEYDQLTESIKLLEQHRAAKVLAEDNYNLSVMNYNAGMSTMTDLLMAETMLLTAENNYTDAHITFLTAQRKFNDYNR